MRRRTDAERAADDAVLLGMWKDGATDEEIAQRLGVTGRTVAADRKRLGCSRRPEGGGRSDTLGITLRPEVAELVRREAAARGESVSEYLRLRAGLPA